MAGIRPTPPKDTSNITDRQCTGQETRYLTLSSSADGGRRLLWRIYSPYPPHNLDISVFHALRNYKKLRFMPFWRQVNIHASCVMRIDPKFQETRYLTLPSSADGVRRLMVYIFAVWRIIFICRRILFAVNMRKNTLYADLASSKYSRVLRVVSVPFCLPYTACSMVRSVSGLPLSLAGIWSNPPKNRRRRA